MPAPAEAPVAFARLLRRRGLDVPGTAVLSFTEALAALDVGRPEATYWAGRATLVRRAEDIAAYDRAFADFWTRPGRARRPAAGRRSPSRSLTDDADDDPDDDDAASRDDRRGRAASCGSAASSGWRARTSRRAPTPSGPSCSTRSPASASAASPAARGGSPRRRVRAAAPTCAAPSATRSEPAARRCACTPGGRGSGPGGSSCCSTSAAAWTPTPRALVRFAHAAVLARRHVEVFTLGTRLTRVTRQLSGPDPDLAVAAADRRGRRLVGRHPPRRRARRRSTTAGASPGWPAARWS